MKFLHELSEESRQKASALVSRAYFLNSGGADPISAPIAVAVGRGKWQQVGNALHAPPPLHGKGSKKLRLAACENHQALSVLARHASQAKPPWCMRSRIM